LNSPLRDQLQATLGDAYTLERELGGGGMSRVFVASETALKRTVVVKVLPPELAAGVNVDRFKREIQVAASLHHPHIVPVHAAGETNGLPYYTMPFVEGESLRARLGRGPLPITEAVSVLRDVAKALAFAHEHGVVHRDIKPDNVMITGGSASVTDFGIAKAISAARDEGPGNATLTQVGTSLGTPAYMSPEQAAGDPTSNHRTDIYSFGVMAYEVLAGRPPFHGMTPQKLLAAQMAERPEPVQTLRPDTPPALAELVMRCQEKDADQRPQRAADLAVVLDSVTTTTGGTHAAMPAVLLGGRGMLRKALAIYVASFVVVAVLARAAIIGIGLPDWVFPGALLVMGLGLPVILFTAYVHRTTHRVLTSTPTLTPGGSPGQQGTMATIAMKAAPHVSWRRTTLGGVWAGGVFVALVAGWMILRALGIGPAGSLMAAGKLGSRERMILTEFKSPATDSLLGPTVTEAFRTDLAQSPNLSIMPATNVREVLRRMQKPPNTRVDYAIAREVATREGMKAVLDGEVVALGGGYVLSARLVTAQSGEELATFRQTAADAKDIIPAISRLSKQVRSKVGESLRSVQAARTLDKVTTPSLEALQKYVAGTWAIEADGDFEKGRTLLEEAIAVDTGFAMAYRKLAIELSNRGVQSDRRMQLMQKAYDHRDRLSDAERYLTVASYYSGGPAPDRSKRIAAYESLLDLDPDNRAALNNLAIEYNYRRDYARAEQMLKHAMEVENTTGVLYSNLVAVQIHQGKVGAAEQTVALAAQAIPRNPVVGNLRSGLLDLRQRYDSSIRIADSLAAARPNDANAQAAALNRRATVAELRGQLNESLRQRARLRDIQLASGNRQARLNGALDGATFDLWYRGNNTRGLEAIRQALARYPIESLPPAARTGFAPRLIILYSLAGRPDLARPLLPSGTERILGVDSADVAIGLHGLRGSIAMAEQKYDEAAREYRAADVGSCSVCALPDIGRAYDLAGNADSAIAVFARYTDGFERPLGIDARNLAGVYKRLGELYEARGDGEKAMSHYAQFIELWKTADSDLQPLVRQARARLTVLQRAEKK
jgi:eukaryotic-like serine/threonine-protein kinase